MHSTLLNGTAHNAVSVVQMVLIKPDVSNILVALPNMYSYI
jgi:hypothetical protein